MHRGWVKLWAKLEDSEVFADPVLLKVWIWCLLRANRAEGFFSVNTGSGTKTVRVGRGQFVYGRNEAAKALKLPPSTVRNKLSRLGTMGNVDIKPDKLWSVVTINKYEEFQQVPVQHKDKPRTSQGQAVDTIEKLRGLESKKDLKTSSSSTASSDAPTAFESFWTAYPKKVGKGAARKAWDKAKKRCNGSRNLLEIVLAALEKQTASEQWTRDAGQFIPHPATWLNQDRWEDETEADVEERETEDFRERLRLAKEVHEANMARAQGLT